MSLVTSEASLRLQALQEPIAWDFLPQPLRSGFSTRVRAESGELNANPQVVHEHRELAPIGASFGTTGDQLSKVRVVVPRITPSTLKLRQVLSSTRRVVVDFTLL